MSRLTAFGVTDVLNFYRTTWTRARAVGINNTNQDTYTTSFQNIDWTTASIGTDGAGRSTGNINLSTPLEWTDIPANVDIFVVEIYPSNEDIARASYALDETRSFSATGTLRIDTLPTNVNSTTT